MKGQSSRVVVEVKGLNNLVAFGLKFSESVEMHLVYLQRSYTMEGRQDPHMYDRTSRS